MKREMLAENIEINVTLDNQPIENVEEMTVLGIFLIYVCRGNIYFQRK